MPQSSRRMVTFLASCSQRCRSEVPLSCATAARAANIKPLVVNIPAKTTEQVLLTAILQVLISSCEKVSNLECGGFRRIGTVRAICQWNYNKLQHSALCLRCGTAYSIRSAHCSVPGKVPELHLWNTPKLLVQSSLTSVLTTCYP